MRSRLACAALTLALVACTRAGPPPPDFESTREAIRIELTAMAPTPVPLPEVATPPSVPTATVPAPASATPTATETAVATAMVPATTTPLAEATPTPVTYIVQQGDYPGQIAALFGVPVELLMEVNGITDPRALTIGQVLVIPFPEATATAEAQ